MGSVWLFFVLYVIRVAFMKKFFSLIIVSFLLCLTAQSWAAPAAPTMTYETNGLDITVTWTKVPEATNYTLYSATHPFITGGFIGSSDRGNETSFTIELPASASYYIAVRAKNESGESDYSNIEHFTIEMPTVSSVYRENGWLENIQVLLLLLSCIIILRSIVYQSRTDKLLLSLFFLTCLTFILREVDVEDFNIPYVLIFIGSGVGRNVMLTIGFLTISFCVISHAEHYKGILRRYLMSMECALVATAGVFLCLGVVIEKSLLISHNMFWEEMSELVGYGLILLAAFACSRNNLVRDSKRQPSD